MDAKTFHRILLIFVITSDFGNCNKVTETYVNLKCGIFVFSTEKKPCADKVLNLIRRFENLMG